MPLENFPPAPICPCACVCELYTAATVGDGAVEIMFNYVNNSSILCRQFGVYDVQSGKLTCFCPAPYVLAPDGISCVGTMSPYLSPNNLNKF